jgi:hypothetical protein
MLHPATQAVERYYTLFNQRAWSEIVAMFVQTARTCNSALDPPTRGASGVALDRRVATPRAAGQRER